MARIVEKKEMKNIIVLFLLSSWLVSCKVANKIPPQKRLYGGSSIRVVQKDSLAGGEIPEFKTVLEDATRPSPNTMLFGYPYKVAFSFFLGKKKKETGLKEWFRKRLGEDPVFVDSYIVEQNITNLTSLLHAYGYFNSSVKGDIKEKKILGFANYEIDLNQRFKIDSVLVSQPEDTEFHEDFFSLSQKFRLPKYFNLERIRTERELMYGSMRNLGYYYFRPEYVNVLLDSTQRVGHLIGKVSPRKDIPEVAKRRYQINNVYVSIDTPPEVFNYEDGSTTDLFRGLVLNDPNKRFKEPIFLSAMAFRPGAMYNTDAARITNNRLLGLGNFSAIQSQFNVVNKFDSTLIDVYYNLKTTKKKSLRLETNAISRSSGLAGTQASLSWQNNNTFKGAEFLKIGVNANFEFQLGGNRESTQYNENYRTGAEISLSFPRFIAPFIKIDPEVSNVLPKTQITLSYENFIKKGLYDLNSANASWGYAWTRGRGIEHIFRPFTFSFVKSSNLGEAFIKELFLNPNLYYILENQFILGSSYEINIVPKRSRRNFISYNGKIDAAGSLLSLRDELFVNKNDRGNAFGEKYSQFVRLENEVRYRKEISRDLSWANRAIVGLGMPYGNSLQLPFVKQFFVGGNNSLRAFRARGVGPGSFIDENAQTAVKFLGTNTGDIKLELNTELRYKFTSLIGGALFVDAGNVWLYKDPFIYDERAVFSKNFIKELAVGGGVGLRLDFSFIVFRIDVATPFRKPWYEEKKRWVFNEMNLGDKDWRKENIIWNFAVGLPF